jgi:hypothetical protein
MLMLSFLLVDIDIQVNQNLPNDKRQAAKCNRKRENAAGEKPEAGS